MSKLTAEPSCICDVGHKPRRCKRSQSLGAVTARAAIWRRMQCDLNHSLPCYRALRHTSQSGRYEAEAKMLKDLELQQAVEEQLSGNPELHGTEIEVSVREGIVTLNGTVHSLPEKWATEKTVQHVQGVCAIVDETVLNLPGDAERSDAEIARAAITSLEAMACVPHKEINLLVRNGFITLQGEVQYFYQVVEIERAVHGLMGVRGIYNQLEVNPPVSVIVVKEEIEKALECVEQMDAKRVSVQVTNNRVLLKGEVKTWREHEAAGNAASSITGVKDVKNEIRVIPWMF